MPIGIVWLVSTLPQDTHPGLLLRSDFRFCDWYNDDEIPACKSGSSHTSSKPQRRKDPVAAALDSRQESELTQDAVTIETQPVNAPRLLRLVC
jgi:hypothetical protein